MIFATLAHRPIGFVPRTSWRATVMCACTCVSHSVGLLTIIIRSIIDKVKRSRCLVLINAYSGL